MDGRQLVGLALVGGAVWAVTRRAATTLPGTSQSGSTANFPAWLNFPALSNLKLDIDLGAILTGGTVGAFVESYLVAHGIPAAIARGVAAGAYAESRLDPGAVNPTSGAFGIGQWLGSRKAELLKRYGARPSLSQQLEFLVWELRGGDHGGAAVLAQSTPHGALDAYIRRFMRPAPGAETAGDLARGARYLAQLG